MKRCTCCKRLISAGEWLDLPFVVVHHDEDDVQQLVLWNCQCGSTLGLPFVRNVKREESSWETT